MTQSQSLNLVRFSDFVSEMNERAVQTDAEGLARWAVHELSETLGFEGAWYGWAQIEQDGVKIHANASLNKPEDYYDFWQTIADHDLLAKRMLEAPHTIATYDRNAGSQNEGMTALADRYALNKIATVMNKREGRLASFYLSGYRMGKGARAFDPSEQEFLQCAVNQLGRAMKLSSIEDSRRSENDAISILVNESGIGILGLGNLRDQLGNFWPGWDGDRLPDTLRKLIDVPGTHFLVDHNMVVVSEEAPNYQDMGLRRLTLRKITPVDHLTAREGEVAQLLAAGNSHKEVARLLGVAPSTVRNQTRAIYEKTGVNNRAELALLVSQG